MARGRIDVTQRANTSCIVWTAALIAAATLAASCATAPPAPSVPTATQSARAEQGATDEILANAVYSALNADPVYYYRHVDVDVDNGVAHLSGYVWSTDAIYAARRIASNVPGVTGVMTNQLQLERNGRDTGPAR
jgi:osmotically-inducible protein OsmY